MNNLKANPAPYSASMNVILAFGGGVTAAAIATSNNWPTSDAPPYEIKRPTASYSELEKHFPRDSKLSEVDFITKISEFYSTLVSNQEPLGEEFEAVWDSNIDELYES